MSSSTIAILTPRPLPETPDVALQIARHRWTHGYIETFLLDLDPACRLTLAMLDAGKVKDGVTRPDLGAWAWAQASLRDQRIDVAPAVQVADVLVQWGVNVVPGYLDAEDLWASLVHRFVRTGGGFDAAMLLRSFARAYPPPSEVILVAPPGLGSLAALAARAADVVLVLLAPDALLEADADRTLFWLRGLRQDFMVLASVIGEAEVPDGVFTFAVRRMANPGDLDKILDPIRGLRTPA